MDKDVSQWFEDDEYEFVRPLATLFRNIELVGTKLGDTQSGHFVHPEFILATYWSNNNLLEKEVAKKIEIPGVSNATVAEFCKFLEHNTLMHCSINEENLEEMLIITYISTSKFLEGCLTLIWFLIEMRLG